MKTKLTKRRETSTLTTGEAGKLIGVGVQTMGRLVDSGGIASFKIPGSTHRRILKDAFYKYCEDNHIPILNQEKTCPK